MLWGLGVETAGDGGDCVQQPVEVGELGEDAALRPVADLAQDCRDGGALLCGDGVGATVPCAWVGSSASRSDGGRSIGRCGIRAAAGRSRDRYRLVRSIVGAGS